MARNTSAVGGVTIPEEYQYWLSKESLWGWLFLLPTLAALGLISVVPILRGIVLSFYEYGGLREDVFVGFENYARVFALPDFWVVMKNTFVWSFTAVVLMAILGLGFAILLNREFRGRSIATTLLLLPWTIPFIAVALNWTLLFNYELGMFNGLLEVLGFQGVEWLGRSRYALFSVTMAYVWRNFPFFMITFLAAMKGIPQDLYEAAQVDGSTRLDLFRHITLPFLQPIGIVTTLLQSLWTLNHFTLVFVMTSGGPGNSSMVLPVYIYRQAFIQNNFGVAAAIAVVMLVIMLGYGLVYLRLYEDEVGGK
ncbi:carbohydrate ABC transporter permease [Halopelagius longus]|uniref:Carbohydrate ABC transporter membrane protein 1, CUT1 family n=1 Tax=Halopelagius longus TaxID=1236180 RepID=A0A1H1FMF4_9EURY|nr:sugar ABC transporter permease [Halopelagius longus]RDI70038.1 sugar ABC transporter permease [Halopelagius longus]SDR01909.1 carbohydrate ABC transporter membrane protein 1, CUT1 family [Halopelagius longus]